MRFTLNLLHIGLLIIGLTISARPVARQIKRICFQQIAALNWKRLHGTSAIDRPGEPCAWLTIPHAGIDLPVLKGIEKAELARAPGCIKLDRALLIAAHRDTHFRGLKNLQLGDSVTLERHDGTQCNFQISERIITDADSAQQVVAGFCRQDRLILLTCYPFQHIGPAPSRIIFLADPA